MLNPITKERELVYVVKVSEVRPIEGKDRVECAVVNGWTCMVPKGAFKPGQLGIYFEIDSLVPSDNEAFAFLKSKKYKIKTQKYGNFYSQGLLMSARDLGWYDFFYAPEGVERGIYNPKQEIKHREGDFLTRELGVSYYDPDDRARKAAPADEVTLMKNWLGKKAKNFPYSQLLSSTFGRKVLWSYLSKKNRKKKNSWPSHIAQKTDVERIQNMPYILSNKEPFVATEKIDGSSCSIMCEKKAFGRIHQYVCSRNVVFKDPNQECYYDTNIYYEAYQKYNLEEKIVQILKDYHLPNIALQMEVYGEGVQKRDYSTKEHKIAVFHIVSNGKKMPMEQVVEICEKYDLPHVPILDTNYILPDTLEELQEYVEGEPSRIDGLPKEGIVFYDKTGQQYFKFVSPNFLMKYHG